MSRFLYTHIRAGLLCGLLLCCLPAAAQAQSQRLLVLGDSISAAYGMSLEQGWVALLQTRLAQQDADVEVINASISGETTGGGLRRLPKLLEDHQPTLVLIELGGNDGLRGYPLQRLQGNLAGMVELAQDSGANVILVPMEIPPNYGSRYTAGFRDSFIRVAEQTDAKLAPFILDGVAIDPELMQADGIHPTVAAQPILLDNVLPTIEAALAQK
ncbi:MAG: arylesterase [Pseudomonadota bacterium]